MREKSKFIRQQWLSSYPGTPFNFAHGGPGMRKYVMWPSMGASMEIPPFICLLSQWYRGPTQTIPWLTSNKKQSNWTLIQLASRNWHLSSITQFVTLGTQASNTFGSRGVWSSEYGSYGLVLGLHGVTYRPCDNYIMHMQFMKGGMWKEVSPWTHPCWVTWRIFAYKANEQIKRSAWVWG